ncbi:DNA cytosine methyltransferase [Serratia rhizosphaerae]|uniref:DNA cytosine methyltransferase n=1 Tax=Serratia rhizosphaerae TaxID=2597702 RepID=A0ABX6GH25_9GAMM|nr:DNA cytosine methyltransferase [Serratia rhizosphaerae]QHA85577.1 DNA cytosine methyltransferase [Serratia rhizosphaerae]
MREIIVDNFAGGGGASTGIEMATGRSVDIAINHDVNAIAMHTTNHPETLHYCESVFDIDPVAATAGRPVGLAWFSPDCRHFSKAKGSAPVKKEIRGLAWIVIRWALRTQFRCGYLENVEEFKTWGPLVADADGNERPCPARAGETFEAFVAMLSTGINADHPALAECCETLGIEAGSDDHQRLIHGLGYAVDFRELRACDYGAPTIRRRFFMVMRCDGKHVVWPEPTHGDPKSLEVQSGKLQPWRTAAECIDWSIPCPSIFERKRPLAENTLRRIARGLQRFVLNNPSPFIVGAGGSEYQAKPRSADMPMHTILKESRAALVTPYIARIGQTGFGGTRMAYNALDPLTTVTSKAEHLLVAPIIARQFGASVGHRADEPSATITAGGGGKSQLVAPTLIQVGYGEGPGQAPRALDLGKSLGTVTAGGNKFAIAAAHLIKHYGGNYTGAGAGLDEPTHTVTTTDHHALVSSHLVKLRGTCKDGQAVTEPMPTITAGGLHIGEVRAFLLKYYGNEKEGLNIEDPLHTVTSRDRFGLVTVAGIDYQIVDIGMRMLQPHELYAAQGFPGWYIIDQDYRGVKYAKDKQVARCGNAVPPPFAEALVRANQPELCVSQGGIAA